MEVYVNKIEVRITFEIKTRYKFLTPKTMKLFGSNENKITKDKNDEDVAHLEIKEMVLIHCNIVNDDYQTDSRIFYTFVPNKPFSNLLEVSQQIISFEKHLTQHFKPLKCILMIKIVNHYKQNIE